MKYVGKEMKYVGRAKSFANDESGNFSIMLAVGASCLMAAIGIAVDFSDGINRKNALQYATDAAVLAAASSGETKKKDLEEIALAAFKQNISLSQGESLERFKFKYSAGGQLEIETQLKKPTHFMGVVGKKSMSLTADSASISSSSSALDVVLVLDRTGSMAGAKMAGLIQASRGYITDLDDSKADIRVAVVPFSDYVNIGAENFGKPWLDMPVTGSQGADVDCQMASTSVSGCVAPPSTSTPTTPSTPSGGGSCSVSTISSSGGYTVVSGSSGSCSVSISTTSSGTFVWSDIFTSPAGAYCSINADPQENSGSLVEECTPQMTNENWFGCVGSREAPYNTQAAYGGQKIPLVYDRTCGQPLTELTSNLASVTADISALTASGSTYIPAGLQWGWRNLETKAPFQLNGGQDRKKLLILMTDGQNTRSQVGTIHNGNDYAAADALTQSLCTAMKAEGITIATVSYSNGGSSSINSKMLSDCASTADMHFDASSAVDLEKAFSRATNNVHEVRLTR